MKVLHIGLLVDLGNFEVVQFLYHVPELPHNFTDLAWFFDASMPEDGYVLRWNGFLLELEDGTIN